LRDKAVCASRASTRLIPGRNKQEQKILQHTIEQADAAPEDHAAVERADDTNQRIAQSLKWTGGAE